MKNLIKKTHKYIQPVGNRLLSAALVLNVLSFQAGLAVSPDLTKSVAAAFESAVWDTTLYDHPALIAKRLTVTLTAYSSTPDQTDDTPFITASNKRVRDGIVAANFLPFGTKIMVPELFGDKIFVVEDRMHRRFSDRVDIWFAERADAKRFGRRQADILVLAY
ncbi:MAG: hypothetical protein Q8O87_02340 [bacterium]|nr:hypothetical protein [bacterium]